MLNRPLGMKTKITRKVVLILIKKEIMCKISRPSPTQAL